MKRLFTSLVLIGIMLLYFPLLAQNPQNLEYDWGGLNFFKKENASLTQQPIAVFMGNSITQGWRNYHPDFFKNNNYAGRGISGQVTAQMLSRFRQDVIELHPKVVVILAGINDVAQNNGFVSTQNIYDNIVSMLELAKINKIKAILIPVLPTDGFSWRSEEFNTNKDILHTIYELNAMLELYVNSDKNATMLYIWDSLTDERGCIKKEYSNDGVHPLPAAYDIMEEQIVPVIKKLAK